ncbi:hypothetical protein [Gilvibacter sp.]|uniref:hypothetical protein n=1 Tax=Gilvibacter sp. TaxID=2729997 RepID=UPI0035BEA179
MLCFSACKQQAEKFDPLPVAEKYYSALNRGVSSALSDLINDTLTTLEPKYDYEQKFSLVDYTNWLEWDAVFSPTYELQSMEVKDGVVEAVVSKMDKRIAFLHEEPTVIRQALYFNQGKISAIETREELKFNAELWNAKRQLLLDWIAANHPEMESFIFDQTKAGGRRYLKALDLYAARDSIETQKIR